MKTTEHIPAFLKSLDIYFTSPLERHPCPLEGNCGGVTRCFYERRCVKENMHGFEQFVLSRAIMTFVRAVVELYADSRLGEESEPSYEHWRYIRLM